jgi:hypothetical protein
MKVITETYMMKVITETYMMKVITETYMVKVITETYLIYGSNGVNLNLVSCARERTPLHYLENVNFNNT